MRRPNHAGLSVIAAMLVLATGACSRGDEESGPKLGDGNPTQINPAASGEATFMSPFDATPDPSGKTVYFTALTLDGEPGVFKVAASGGAVERLHVGPPLVTPQGIAITDDGKTLVIADPSADRDEETDGNGSLFSLSTAGGAPAILAGSEGFRPRGLEIKETEIFFSGVDKDHKPGLFKVGVAGGAPTPLAVGEPFSDPSGVAIRKNGDVYVADSSPIGEGAVGSAVIKVVDGKAEIYKTDIAVGHPAGIALSQDDSALLVSGLSPETGTDLVFRFDLGSGEMKTFDQVIKGFQESAGLHRAKGAEVYAWADSRANKNGTVYVLSN